MGSEGRGEGHEVPGWAQEEGGVGCGVPGRAQEEGVGCGVPEWAQEEGVGRGATRVVACRSALGLEVCFPVLLCFIKLI